MSGNDSQRGRGAQRTDQWGRGYWTRQSAWQPTQQYGTQQTGWGQATGGGQYATGGGQYGAGGGQQAGQSPRQQLQQGQYQQTGYAQQPTQGGYQQPSQAGYQQPGGYAQQGQVQQAGVGTQAAAPAPAMGPIRPTRIEDLARTDVVTTPVDTPIRDVIAEMGAEQVGSIVVVEDDKPVGILTDREIALALDERPDVANLAAGDVVSRELVTIAQGTSLDDLLETLSEAKVRRAPIVDDQGYLQGIVTVDDVLMLLASELSAIAEIVRAQSPPR